MSDAQLAAELEGAFRSVALEATLVADPFPEHRTEARNLQILFAIYLGMGLIIGIVGIGLLTVRSVLVRRREIGTLRALGATPNQVVLIFAIEALYLTLAALAIGLVGALLIAAALLRGEGLIVVAVLDWPVLLPFYGATVIAALLMAFVAARQAAGMEPAKALRYVE